MPPISRSPVSPRAARRSTPQHRPSRRLTETSADKRRPQCRQDRHAAHSTSTKPSRSPAARPTLTLNDGGIATYTGGSGTNALTFSYTVAAGQNTAGLAATAVNLNSATITDGAGNAANLSLTGLTQSGPQIDTTPPPTPTAVTGSTSLAQLANNYFLFASGGMTGPELRYNGAAVASGMFGSFNPIGAVQTANGYEIAWQNASTGQYTVWSTDSNGNYTGNLIGAVSGNSYALESLEPVFNQDLNGDGVTGLNPLVIHDRHQFVWIDQPGSDRQQLFPLRDRRDDRS